MSSNNPLQNQLLSTKQNMHTTPAPLKTAVVLKASILGLQPRKVAERGRGSRRGDSITPAAADSNRHTMASLLMGGGREDSGAGDSLLIRVRKQIAESRATMSIG